MEGAVWEVPARLLQSCNECTTSSGLAGGKGEEEPEILTAAFVIAVVISVLYGTFIKTSFQVKGKSS